MLDIHTHILPKIDDGATSNNMALEMLNILQNDGVLDVVLTPHFYSDMESLESFLKKRDEAYTNFISFYRTKQKKINLHLGAEVYITKYLSQYKNLTKLCIDKTKYMLVELPFDVVIKDETFEYIENLIYNHNITPIIAHVERYPFIKNEKEYIFINKLKSIGCLIQVNTESFLTRPSKKIVLSLIESNLVDFLGSDSHDLIHRPPVYKQALDVIKSKLGPQYISNLSSNLLNL